MAKAKAKKTKKFWVVGTPMFIRTVTHHITGRLVSIDDHEVILEDAAWIADDGRFAEALKSPDKFNEVEPFPDGIVAVGRGAIIDACHYLHDLPRKTK